MTETLRAEDYKMISSARTTGDGYNKSGIVAVERSLI